MRLLAIDTSSPVTVLGLLLDGEVIDRTPDTVPSRYHSRDILPAIEQLLAGERLGLDALDGIVFGQGPGSFTGLRIAVGVVQGLAYGLRLPVVPVSSMACLAQAGFREHPGCRVAVALKARLQEVYFGTYEFNQGVACQLGPELVVDVTQTPRQENGPWLGIGDGWEFRDQLELSLGITLAHLSPPAQPTVENLLTIGQQKFTRGETRSALDAMPQYLREEVARSASQKPQESTRT